MPLSLIRRYSVYLAFCDGWAQVPDGWAQIIDDWAQARSGPPLATPLTVVLRRHNKYGACNCIWIYTLAHAKLPACHSQHAFNFWLV